MAGISWATPVEDEAISPPVLLVEREHEVAVLRRAVDTAARGHGRAVMVDGSSGTGKTRLIEVACELVGDAGVPVRVLTGKREEAAAPLRAMRPLLRELRLDAMPAGDALWHAVAARLETGPMALIVDDAHWLDVASARFLRGAGAHVADVPLLLVVTRRPEGDGPAQRVLDELRGEHGVRHLRPAALGPAGIRAIAVERFGEDEAVDALVEACLKATGGHPFCVGELLAELRAGTASAGEAAARAASVTPGSVRRLVAAHLDGLSSAARALAHAVAVLGPGCASERYVEIARLDGERAAEAARELDADGLGSDSSGPSLRHRVVRAAALAALDASGDGAPVIRANGTRARLRAVEPLRRVRGDLHSAGTGDPAALGAAMRALFDGRPAAVAAGLAARALASGAPASADASRLQGMLGIIVLACCGDHDAALAELAEARADPELHASSAGRALVAAVGARVDLAAGRLADAHAGAALAAEIAPHAIVAGLALSDALLALERAAEAHVAARRFAGTGGSGEQAQIALACARACIALGGRRSGLRELLEAAERLGPHGRNESYLPWREDAVSCLVSEGRVEQAAGVAEAGLANQRAFGEPVGLARALMASAHVAREPAQALEEAVELLRGTPNAHERARALLAHGAKLAARGRLADARERLAAGARDAAAAGAPRLARRIADALTAAGGRPRAVLLRPTDALTPAEWRVARLATSGRTNRDIGDELFLTEKTVEGHLTSIYRKLGVRGRAALDDALREPGSNGRSR